MKAIALGRVASLEVPVEKKELEKAVVEVKSNEKVESARRKGEDMKKSPNVYTPSKYDPPLPFPERVVERKLNEKYNKFMTMLNSLQVSIPFLDDMSEMPSYATFLKRLLISKKKLNDNCVLLPHQVSALVQQDLPPKQQDPGSFTLP